jgi:hypothetical protein
MYANGLYLENLSDWWMSPKRIKIIQSDTTATSYLAVAISVSFRKSISTALSLVVLKRSGRISPGLCKASASTLFYSV